MNTRLKIENLSFFYDGEHILEDINLEVKDGEVVALLGESGVGKSTIFHIVAGIYQANGKIVLNQNNHILKIGYMQQKDLLLEHKNILDNVALPLILNGYDKKIARQKALIFLDNFGLLGYENAYPKSLSGGMKSRACFARAMIAPAALYMFDEPFSSLDMINKLKMYEYFLSIKKSQNFSALLITHDIDEALELADRIYVIKRVGGFSSITMNIKADKSQKNTIISHMMS